MTRPQGAKLKLFNVWGGNGLFHGLMRLDAVYR